MATIYKVEIVSHWISYSEQDIKKMIEEALKPKERKKGNDIQVSVEKCPH